MRHPYDNAHLDVSRQAAKLFLERGVASTSAEHIAQACRISKRTIWRYFRNKESCIAPLFSHSWSRFTAALESWPLEASLESQLTRGFELEALSPQDISDSLLVINLVAALDNEPDLRATWLLAYHEGEAQMTSIIADRMQRSRNDFDVRLCAAAVMGALRTVDETLCIAAVRDGQSFTGSQVAVELTRAIQAVSNLPFYDPVKSNPFGSTS